jgi:hypothetical protein
MRELARRIVVKTKVRKARTSVGLTYSVACAFSILDAALVPYRSGSPN